MSPDRTSKRWAIVIIYYDGVLSTYFIYVNISVIAVMIGLVPIFLYHFAVCQCKCVEANCIGNNQEKEFWYEAV